MWKCWCCVSVSLICLFLGCKAVFCFFFLLSFQYWPGGIWNTSSPLHSAAQSNRRTPGEKTTSPTANYIINCLSDPIWHCSKWSKSVGPRRVSALTVWAPRRACHPQSGRLKHLIAALPLVCLAEILPLFPYLRSRWVSATCWNLDWGCSEWTHVNTSRPPFFHSHVFWNCSSLNEAKPKEIVQYFITSLFTFYRTMFHWC